MNSRTRRDILRVAVGQLVISARERLPDKFTTIDGIGRRPILAIDATYQQESSHYARVLPKAGGDDNQKGPMLLTYYDLRCGMPVGVTTETRSRGEMRVLKEAPRPLSTGVVFGRRYRSLTVRLWMAHTGMNVKRRQRPQ